ncbi:MAG: hypothetical protein ISS33_02860 [Candidatus Omnitrophica bacterium]|nr:hypothetical protein [Candidatus Omnitrophota bacterium]
MKLFNRVIKMGLTGLVFVFAVSATAYAGRAVSITGGPWAIGTVGMSLARTTTGDTFTATNEGDVTSTVYIKVTGASLSPGAGAGADIFVLKHDASGSWSDAITNVGSGIELASLTAAAGQTFDLQFTAPSSTTAEGEQTLTVTLTAGEYVWAPGDPITVSHTAGDGISPVTVDITYGTVVTSISGAEKCWITRNLGATQQATAVDDATAASAGWYWQFNRKQGYAVGPSPAWTITSINESESYTDSGSNASNWNPALDPCALLLGAGWRLPTSGEYTNVDVGTTWSWAFGSDLVLHAAGYLDDSDGALYSRGVYGHYWSSTQSSTTYGYILYFASTSSNVYNSSKANGFSVRCLSD